MVAGRVHRRRRPGVRGADPPAGHRAPGRRVGACSTSAAVRARWRGTSPRDGAARVVGVDPSDAQLAVAARRGGRPALRPRCSRRAAVPDGASTRVACLVFEHIADRRRRDRRSRPGAAPRRRVPVPPEPPAAPGAGQRLDRRPHPGEQYWRIGAYLVEDVSMEELAPGVMLPFVHRPLSRYLNAMAGVGLLLEHMDEPAPARVHREGARVRRGGHDPPPARAPDGQKRALSGSGERRTSACA